MVREIKNCFLLVYHRHKTEEEISKCEDKESIGTEEPGRPQSMKKITFSYCIRQFDLGFSWVVKHT